MPRSIAPLHIALFVGIAVIWGFNFAVAKTGLAHMPPILFIALRFTLVAILLVPFVKFPKEHWRQIFGVSITLGLLHFSIMFTGLKTLDAATAAIAIQLQVPFAALLAAVFFKDTLGWRRALGMATAFAGVALIAGEPRLDGQYLALFFVILAACIWSVASVQIKLMPTLDGFSLNAWVAVFSTPMLFLASYLLEEGQGEALASMNWVTALAVVYQAVLVVVVGYGVWYWLLRRYSLNQAMPFTLLIPLFGVLSGILFLGERMTPFLVGGGLLTVLGVAIIVIRRPKVAAPDAGRI